MLALLVGTSNAVPLQLVLGLALEGLVGSHRDHRSSIILLKGVMGLPRALRGYQKNASLDITRISVLIKVSPDWQHGPTRWTRACQLAAQSPRGEVVTAQAARGQLNFLSTARPC